MNIPRSEELPSLVAKLSDGTLTSDEMQRLNALLKADPIAQEEYLDHLLIDGLLQREFSVVTSDIVAAKDRLPPGQPESHSAKVPRARLFRFHGAKRAISIAAVTIVAAVGLLFWTLNSIRPHKQAIPIADSGFESKTSPTDGILNAAWLGDPAEVVDQFSDVVPLEGHRMLRFVKSTREPTDGCEIYQIVDLREAIREMSNRTLSIEASAFFNSVDEIPNDGDYTFRVTVFAFSEDPFPQSVPQSLRWENALAFSGSQTLSDVDPKTWQPVKTSLSLPPDTRYLIVQLSTSGIDDAEDEFPGHFADKVKVNLVCMQ